MLNNPLRIIIDTNLWISFLITGKYTKLNPLIFSGEIVLIFSSELLSEFIRVTARTKFSRYFSIDDVAELAELIEEYAEFINVVSDITICRDLKDNFLLSLAADSRADYLISGDNDLLELKEIGSTRITTISDFLQLYNI